MENYVKERRGISINLLAIVKALNLSLRRLS